MVPPKYLIMIKEFNVIIEEKQLYNIKKEIEEINCFMSSKIMAEWNRYISISMFCFHKRMVKLLP